MIHGSNEDGGASIGCSASIVIAKNIAPGTGISAATRGDVHTPIEGDIGAHPTSKDWDKSSSRGSRSEGKKAWVTVDEQLTNQAKTERGE